MTLNSAPNFTGSEPVQAGVGIVNQVFAMAEREDGSCLKDAVADAILSSVPTTEPNVTLVLHASRLIRDILDTVN